MRRNQTLDFSGIKTYDANDRINLVTIENMMTPGVTPHEPYTADGFEELIDRIASARKNGRPVIWSMGAHVVKNRLSRYIIELMKMGIITHIAANGATSIHDFELAYLGGTSEDVPTAIEDGSFGMWEQTGAWMNERGSATAKRWGNISTRARNAFQTGRIAFSGTPISWIFPPLIISPWGQTLSTSTPPATWRPSASAPGSTSKRWPTAFHNWTAACSSISVPP